MTLANPHGGDLWYHGTSRDFARFRSGGPPRNSRNFEGILGYHFAADDQTAEGFATGWWWWTRDNELHDGYVLACRLDIKSPRRFATVQDLAVQALWLGVRADVITDARLENAINRHSRTTFDQVVYMPMLEELQRLLPKIKRSDKPVPFEDAFHWLGIIPHVRPPTAQLVWDELAADKHDGLLYEAHVGKEFILTAVPRTTQQIQIVSRRRVIAPTERSR